MPEGLVGDALPDELDRLAGLPANERPFVEFVHDESALDANNTVNYQYLEKNEQSTIRSKSKGAVVMVSAYL